MSIPFEDLFPCARGKFGFNKKIRRNLLIVYVYYQPKAVISLPRYTDTQIHKRRFFFCAKVIYLCNHLLCICFAKKVISLDRYTDTHCKMTIFYWDVGSYTSPGAPSICPCCHGCFFLQGTSPSGSGH